MKNKKILSLVVGFVLFAAGLILLEYGIVGIILLIAGIGLMIFGSVLLMAVSGKVRMHYFGKGQYNASNQASEKVDSMTEPENVWDQLEQKQD